MKNIKNFFIFLTILFSGIECLSRDPALLHVGEKAATILASAVTDATEALAPAAVDAAKGIGVDTVTALADSNVEIAKVAAELGEKGVAVLGIIGIIWASVDSFTKLRPIAKEIYEYYYPTQEQVAAQEARTASAQMKLKNLRLEQNFLDCIMSSNSKTEKNISGCPIVCEEAAILFAVMVGESEVDRMVKALNKYRK
jgi:hypothetical protein